MAYDKNEIPIRIVIVSASGLFREGLVNLLAGPKFQISGQGEDVDEACSQCDADTEPNVLVIAPRSCAEFAYIVTQIKRAQVRIRGLKSVLIVDCPPAREIAMALKTGVAGIVPASISAGALQSALELIVLGQKLFPLLPPSNSLEGEYPEVEFLGRRPKLARISRRSGLLQSKPPLDQHLHAPTPAATTSATRICEAR